ncbi:Panacea domain-containing protein [Devosia faecipullorum]|uniref:Panacea domain-containing protein n=1 Tax=Devosia faecipullorum TaxID=2755039 RepID=UPI00187BBF1E|nr:Panacea domain-containing protein [Devosia faecipullorum]MBE7734421.1 SocA family protein [Devosia faecipullorum]
MAELSEAMAYIIGHYPDHMSHELSNARLTKMVYLADWHYVLQTGGQMTDIKWYFDNFGPFVKDIETTAAQREDLFSVDLGNNMYGQPKKTFSLKNEAYEPAISAEERNSLNHVIEVTKRLYWDGFIKLVYSTHPIASSQRYTYLDLVQKAKEYKAVGASVAGAADPLVGVDG